MTYRKVCLLVIVSSILVSFLIWGGFGILGSSLTIIFSAPVWSSVYMDKKPLSLNKLKSDFTSLGSEGFERIVFLVILHIIVGFNLGRLTLIQDSSLIYFILAFLGYSYAYFKKKKKGLYWFSLGLFPLPFTLFLVLNYYVSFNPVQQTFNYTEYTHHLHSDENEVFIVGSRIILENKAYADYPGIRSFLDRSGMEGNYITYNFKTGIFGVKVVSKREFTRFSPN